MIKLGPNLALPEDAVTKKYVVYGDPGMGKTTLLSVFCEELASNGNRFCFIDPTGSAFGLRFNAEGKGRGIECLILGGTHGDLPITPESGEVVADLVADENVSVIIDIEAFKSGKAWSIEQRIRFVAAFAQRFYMRQREKRTPIMLLIDEAQRFAPQTVDSGEKDVADCRKQLRVIAEEGRTAGIGLLVAAQRSARLDKAISEVTECMIAFRTIGPRSVEAIMDWLGDHVEKTEFKDIRVSLSSMPRGSALFVSPGWLKMRTVERIRMRSTFDSSATPVGGKIRHAVGTGAQIDLARYEQRMAKVLEVAKADDPVELRREIAELRRKVSALELRTGAPDAATIEEIAKVAREQQSRELSPMWQQIYGVWREFAKLLPTAEEFERSMSGPYPRLNLFDDDGNAVGYSSLGRMPVLSAFERAQVDGANAAMRNLRALPVHDPRDHQPTCNSNLVPGEKCNCVGPFRPTLTQVTIPQAFEVGPSTIGKGGLRRILTALAQRPQGLSARQIGVRAGLSSSSGTFGTYLAKARSEGWVEGSRDGMRITKAGVSSLGRFDPLPEGPALARYWIGELKGGAGKMLEALYASRKALTAEQLGEASGLSHASGTFGTYLSRLRSLELITGDRSALRASEELF